MKKQFKDYGELKRYIHKINYTRQPQEFNFLDWLTENNNITPEELVLILAADGYDLNNLLANGYYYNYAGYTNNGWVYDDEFRAEEFKDRVQKRKKQKIVIGRVTTPDFKNTLMRMITVIDVPNIVNWEQASEDMLNTAYKKFKERFSNNDYEIYVSIDHDYDDSNPEIYTYIYDGMYIYVP